MNKKTKKITIDIEGENKVFYITTSPLGDEWPAGDPIPNDKETLGFIDRSKSE